MISLYFPLDEIIGSVKVNYELAADFLELAAFSSATSGVSTSVIANEASIGASGSPSSLSEEIEGDDENPNIEELTLGVAHRLLERENMLSNLYPFGIDRRGDILEYRGLSSADDYQIIGRTAYISSLFLSNLRAVSPILNGSVLHPSERQERDLRRFFQYFATAAVAADIGGDAWSFGFPRPDGSGFMEKLKSIWKEIGDGTVERQQGAPSQPKDDRVDVFAARCHKDGLPGFPLVAAQVATGRDYKSKSLKGHIQAFRRRWYSRQPVTDFIAYMVVPFLLDRDTFVDTVGLAGNVLHRPRVAIRAAEAARLRERRQVEGYDLMLEAARWMVRYRETVMKADRGCEVGPLIGASDNECSGI